MLFYWSQVPDCRLVFSSPQDTSFYLFFIFPEKITGFFGIIFLSGMIFFFQRIGESLKQLQLLLAQMRGSFHDNTDMEITSAAAAERGHTFAFQAQNGAALGSGGDTHFGFAGDGGDVDHTACCATGKRDRQFTEKVISVTVKNFAFTHRDKDIQIPRLTAADTGFAFTGDTQSCAVIDTRLDMELERAFRADLASAVTVGTGFLYDFTRTAASGTGLTHTEKSL
jgi:hypothetical protein